MDNYAIISYLAAVCLLAIFGRVFILPVKTILKLLVNSTLGGVIIYIINWIGGIFGFHIGLNFFTAIIVGILGIPGAMLLVIIKIFI